MSLSESNTLIDMELGFKGKRALVTGAGKGESFPSSIIKACLTVHALYSTYSTVLSDCYVIVFITKLSSFYWYMWVQCMYAPE